MSGAPTWIGSDDLTLSAWVCWPEGEYRGVVVLAPSFGREAVISARAMHVLGRRCAEAGFVSVRFDWRGSGNSAALLGDDPVATWLQDLTTVMDWVRSWADPGLPVHLVGLRLGATLVSAWEGHVPGTRVCWEPVNGSKYLRGSVKLRALSCEVPPLPPAEGVELCGVLLSQQAAERISALRLRTDVPGEDVRSRKMVDRGAADLLYGAHPRFAEVPHQELQALATSLERGSARPLPALPLRSVTEVAHHGHGVTERFVRVGPYELHGVVTEPVGHGAGAIVFTAAGSESLEGPACLWVDIARSEALRGVTSLRAERRGLGVHTDPDAVREPQPYSHAAIDDVAAAAAWIRGQSGSRPVGVGLCVGAWLLVRAATRGDVDRVVAFDNLVWQSDPAYPRRLAEGPWIRRFFAPTNPLPGEAQEAPTDGRARLKESLKLVRATVRHNVPAPVRTALAAAGRMESPASLLSGVPRELPVELHLGEIGEAHFIDVDGARHVQEWVRTGRPVTHHVWHDMDHSALAESARRRIRSVVTAALARPA